MGFQRCDRKEIALELADSVAIERLSRLGLGWRGIVRTAFEPVGQGLEAVLCVLHAVGLVGSLLQRFPVLP